MAANKASRAAAAATAATGEGSGSGAQEPITRVEFDEFVVEVQKKLDGFTQTQMEMANVQADTSENLNKVQAETNCKLDKLTAMLTNLIVRDSTPPDYRARVDMDR